jgi:hypothetical protein
MWWEDQHTFNHREHNRVKRAQVAMSLTPIETEMPTSERLNITHALDRVKFSDSS